MTLGNDDRFSSQDWFAADWTRRGTLEALARGGLGAFLAAAGISSPARAATDELVRIGYLPITDASALLVAHARGLFEQQGLQAEAPSPVRSWSALIEGFAAGRFNVVHFLKPIPVWMRYNNKFPVKLLAWAHTNGSGSPVRVTQPFSTFTFTLSLGMVELHLSRFTAAAAISSSPCFTLKGRRTSISSATPFTSLPLRVAFSAADFSTKDST